MSLKKKKWCPYQLWWDTNIQQISLLFRFAIHSWQYLNRSRVVRRHVHQFVSHTFEVQSRTELPHSRRDVTQEDDSSVLTEPMHGSSRLLAEYVEGREYGWSGDVVCPFVLCVCKQNQTRLGEIQKDLVTMKISTVEDHTFLSEWPKQFCLFSDKKWDCFDWLQSPDKGSC